MIHAQDLYDKAPVSIQNAMVYLSGAIKVHQRYGKTYHEHRAWLVDYDAWSLDRMLEHQAQSLTALIRHASSQSPFYRDLYRDIDLSQVRTPADLPRLAILEKETLRSSMNDVYTVSQRKSTEGHTGGTTGKSLVVRYTRTDEMRRMAMLDHFKSRHGFENLKMPKATFSGKHLVPPGRASKVFWRYNRPANQMLYSTFDISERNLAQYVEHLNQFKPTVLEGFFTSLIDVASYIERHAVPLSFRPIAIFPTSETITPRGRATLERVFGTKVYDQYASSEGAPFVTECTSGALHIELSTGVFEAVPNSNEILVTSFDTRGTPLIRYKIGDAMEFDFQRRCTCGLPSPLVTSIQGRSDDYLVRSDGAKVNGGHVANLFKNMPNALIQAQAIQEQIGHIRILLVTDRSTYQTQHDDLLRTEFLRTFGPTTTLAIEHVDNIPREPSGKQRLIKHLIPN